MGLRAWLGKGRRDRLTPSIRGLIMFDLPAVQRALRDQGVDDWLLYDFRGLNVLARRIIGLKPGESKAGLVRRAERWRREIALALASAI